MALKLWASSAANALKLSSRASAPFLASSISRCFSSVPTSLKYSGSHEWMKDEGEGVFAIGITDHAQDHLGEVVSVDLPESSEVVTQGSDFGAVKSVNATSDIYSPISGEVIEVNSKLTGTPELINTSPYQDGWMIKVIPSDPPELLSLMDSGEYSIFCEEEDAH